MPPPRKKKMPADDIQLALPWGDDAPLNSLARRRREIELADKLRRANRQALRARKDLAESRVIAEGLRRDLAAMTQERDELQARFNQLGLRHQVEADVDPRRFGRREVAR